MSTQTTVTDSTENTQSDQSRTADETGSELVLTYMNNRENVIVIRTYKHHGSFIRSTNQEWMYNYTDETWERTQRFTHDYDLCDDGKRLAGDGSNWRGTHKYWRDWFEKRSVELLRVRFQYEAETITDDVHETHTELPESVRDEVTITPE